jgi:hypothetical protein
MTISRNLSFLAEGVSSTGVLGASNGGSGAATLTGILYGNGTSPYTVATNMTISVSGLNIQATQSAGSTETISWTVFRIA